MNLLRNYSPEDLVYSDELKIGPQFDKERRLDEERQFQSEAFEDGFVTNFKEEKLLFYNEAIRRYPLKILEIREGTNKYYAYSLWKTGESDPQDGLHQFWQIFDQIKAEFKS